MRVFVTGATGWVGSAVVKELISSGHQVTGLTTSPDGAKRLQSFGARACVARLGEHAVLREAAAQSDGVIHTAFIHGLRSMSFGMRARLFAGALNGGIVSSFMRILAETEAGAIGALGAGLAASDRPLVVTSAILHLPHHKVATEEDRHLSNTPNRSVSENTAFAMLEHGIRASAVRLAPTVHGGGDHGLIPQIIEAARKKRVSPYMGDGANRWPAVHRLDAARLFRLALEKGQAGAKYHGVGEIGIPFRDIASSIATRLHVPTVSLPAGKAGKHFGMLGNFVSLNNPASSEWTRETLGWKPEQAGLLVDMEAHYF